MRQKVGKLVFLLSKLVLVALLAQEPTVPSVRLVFTAPQTRTLVRGLSEIVVRCSYAIYLAHNVPVWPHNDDLVSSRRPLNLKKANPPTANIVTLRRQGIRYLYHFTDSTNVPSIQKSGLMSASELLNS